EVSERNDYHRPVFTKDNVSIKNSRHPVIEKVMTDGSFVPNDITLCNEEFILLITGTNMSGKSTYMRKLDLTIIMGQIGCFVTDDKDTFTIFVQIFTSISAASAIFSCHYT